MGQIYIKKKPRITLCTALKFSDNSKLFYQAFSINRNFGLCSGMHYIVSISSFEIILMRKGELVALLKLPF